MQFREHPKQLPAWEPELQNNWRGAVIGSWGQFREHGIRDLQGLFQPEFHGHNGPSCTCRKLSMEEIPMEPRLGHCGCRVLVGRVPFPP